MSKRVVGIALAAAFVVAAISTPAFAAKDFRYETDDNPACTDDVWRHREGWVNWMPSFKPNGGIQYHLVQWYSSKDDGETCCRYMDTGIGKILDDGFTLSGHSVGLWPDDPAWKGHIVVVGGDVTKVGRSAGFLDQQACDVLAD